MTTNLKRMYIVRGLSVLVALQIMSGFISPAMWILFGHSSVVSNVALLSSSASAMAFAWLVCALAIAPFVAIQIFNPHAKHRRIIIKLSNLGMMGGCLVWVFMAFLSRNLDYEFAIWNFLFNGIAALGMAALMANTLNNEQKEKKGSCNEAS